MRSDRGIITILLLAAFLGYLEMTVVITALPTLGRVFPTAVPWLPWLVTVSLMAAGITLPLAGKLADEWGPKRVFLGGMFLFTLGSLLSGLVGIWLPSRIELLIAFRVLQGLGGGVFAPVGLKVVSILYRGTQRTATVGIAGAIGPLAALLGPAAGGFLIDRFPWQAIFLLNVPVGVTIILIALAVMQKTPPSSGAAHDSAGAALLSATVLLLMLGLTWLRDHRAASPLVLASLAGAAVLGGILYRVETHHSAPLLDPSLIGDPQMGTILGLSFVQGVTMYSTLIFFSLYVQIHPAIRATGSTAGAMLSAAAVGQIVSAPVAGVVAAKSGYRPLVAAGTILTALSLFAMMVQPTDLVVLGTLLLASRVGGTITAVPLAAAGLGVRRSQAGAITGMRQLSSVNGGAVGPVALSVIFPAISTSVSCFGRVCTHHGFGAWS